MTGNLNNKLLGDKTWEADSYMNKHRWSIPRYG